MKQNRLTHVAVARAIGVTHPSVFAWLDGSKEPVPTNRRALEKWSNGAIPYSSWPSSTEEEARVGAVQPFEVTG